MHKLHITSRLRLVLCVRFTMAYRGKPVWKHAACALIARLCKSCNNFFKPVAPARPGGPGRPGLPRPGKPGGPTNLAVNSVSWS